MKHVLLDQGLSPAVAVLLTQDGWDVIHVANLGLDQADDLRIITFAEQDQRVCVTLDHDFHTHLALLRKRSPSVVLIRAEGLKAAAQASLIRSVWETCENDLNVGVAVSVDARAIRVRRLPLR